MFGITAVKDLEGSYYAVLEEDAKLETLDKDLLDYDVVPCSDSELAIIRSYLNEPRFERFLETAKPKERFEDIPYSIMVTMMNGGVIKVNVITHTPISIIQRAIE